MMALVLSTRTPQYFISLRKLALLSICLVILIFSIYAEAANVSPSITSPRLTYLDTNNGLSQDSVEALLVDSEGFLWIGNDDGLDRHDGVDTINIRGRDGILENNPVYTIFEYDERYLLLSTGLSGILKFDKQSGETTSVINKSYRFDSQWPQYADVILRDNQNNVIIALNEGVYRLDSQSNELQTIFELSDQQVLNGESIRSLYPHKNIYFIGTTKHLWALDSVSGILHLVLHTNNTSESANNVKLLFSPDEVKLWVGTVEGLYKLDIGGALKYIFDAWDPPTIEVLNETRNIWDIQPGRFDEIYVATDIGLYETSVEGEQLDYLFELNKQYQVLSTSDIMEIEADDLGNLWFATYKSGAMMWSPNSLSFNNVFATTKMNAEDRLSHNVVHSLFQHSNDALWIGTSNGLNKYDLNTGSISQFLVNDGGRLSYSESDIYEINARTRESLWLTHGEGVVEFDIASGEALPNTRFGENVQAALNSFVFSLFAQSTNIIWLSNDDGIIRLDLANDEVFTLPLRDGSLHLASASTASFLGFDAGSQQILLSTAAELWGIDPDTRALRLLHSAAKDGANIMTTPSSWLRDDRDNFWLSYLGIGLYKLNGKNFSQLALFNKQNLLPTNTVYSLSLDAAGDIWFSSHSGVHMLSTTDEVVKSFGYVSGLASSEFNEGASVALADGKLVYGGNLGFTIFSPDELKKQYKRSSQAPVITAISLANRELNLPYSNLSGQRIELDEDDVGLTLKYNMLNFDKANLNTYQYRIIDDGRVTTYPPVTSNEILLPTLESGDYTIEILNANVADKEQAKASIDVRVKHAAHISPLFVMAFAGLVLIIVITLLWRRFQTQKVLHEAGRKVADYNTRLTNALKASNADIWEWQSDTDTFHGPRLIEDLKLNYEAIDFNDFVELLHPEDQKPYLKHWERFVAKDDKLLDITYRLIRGDGKQLWYRDVGSLKILKNGVRTVSGTYTNLTSEMAAKEKLKVFGEAFNHTRDWVLILNKKLNPKAANPSFMQAFGIDDRRPLGGQIKRINEEHKSELKLLNNQLLSLKAGERYKTEASILINGNKMTLLADVKAIPHLENQFNVDHYLCIFTDISEQIQAQQELQKLTNYDALTGLVNRALLVERLKQSIHYSKRHLEKLAVLFIDLDRFKPINDSFGHQAGDKVLIEISQRLSSKFRGQDCVSRLGGDEFVVVLSEIKDRASIEKLCSDLLQLLMRPIPIGQQSINLSASIGIAMYPEHATDAQQLIRNADIAMYQAKENGKNTFAYYASAMDEKAHADILLESKIKVALLQRDFVNYYQPIVNLKTAKTEGFELLLRWIDEGNLIPPDVFIPIAEQIDCIIEMTEQAIECAMVDLHRWYKEGFSGYVSINLSAKHFKRAFNAEMVMGLLHKYHLPVSAIRFEITESLLMENSEISVGYMNALRAYGFKIALDDFGTGYSSLKYLKDFPIDVLKLDKSFVDDVISDDTSSSIVFSTLVMAELLKVDTVAEGVETKEQFNYFLSSKCKLVQGYYFSRPVPVEQTFPMLSKAWFNNHQNSPMNVVNLQSNTPRNGETKG
jgi:diguanylate cyclase (GGDEF)-like protein